MSDPFKLTENEDADEAALADMESKLDELAGDISKNTLAQQELFRQSVAAGGPGSSLEAYRIMMDHKKIGIRALARRVNISRKKLQQMLNGDIPLTPEVTTKLCDILTID